MKAKISALMDGELETYELGESFAALREDDGARDTWRTYHLISDALQGRAMESSACLRRVLARLAQEPTLVAPLPATIRPPERGLWFVPSALAASVAAVALVGWIAFAPQQNTAPGPVAGPGAVPLAKAPLAPQIVRANAPATFPLTSASRDYLLAHQAFSPRNSLLGMVPYARSVADDAAARKP